MTTLHERLMVKTSSQKPADVDIVDIRMSVNGRHIDS